MPGGSKVQKLSICGIRSFSHKEAMAIEFKAPLTVIVGMNGSGKTTIIECLKYVTAGELPPNCASGQSFVHDPKMSGEKEVMAQVKLLFTSVEDVRMVCSRSLSVTMKKESRTFKTLEGSIRMQKGGERNVISSRVAEMNTMMPVFLGVSKAILENVIFCHQESSLWPMLPPKDLKVIFDTIFEAHKYTKAVDNIKVLQKNKRQDLVVLKQGEDHAKADNDKAKKLNKQRERLRLQCKELNEQEVAIEKEIREAQRQWQNVSDQLGEVSLVVGELHGKRIERQTKEESVRILRENLVVMDESDEELHRMLEEHAERIEIYRQEQKVRTNDYVDKDNEVKSARAQQSNREREVGTYDAEKSSNDRKVQTRDQMILDAARIHNISISTGSTVNDESASIFMKSITKAAREQQREFERVRAEHLEKVQDQQKKLTAVNERISGLKSSKLAYRQQIEAHDRKISSIQARKNALPADEGSQATLEAQLREAQDKLKTAKSDLARATWDADIERATSEIRRLEDVRDKLDAEQSEAAQRAGDSAQLDFVQKELKDRQRNLAIMTKAHSENLDATVGAGWTTKTLEAAFQRAQDDSMAQVNEAQSLRDDSVRRAATTGASLHERQEALKAKQKEVQAAEKEIYRLTECQPHEVAGLIAELEQSRDDNTANTASLEQLQKYFEQCIADAKKRNFCRTCARGLREGELVGLLKNVKEQQEKYVVSADNEQILKDNIEALESAKKASTYVDTWERLTEKEIPALKKEISELEHDSATLGDEVVDRNVAVGEKESSQRDIGAHKKTVEKIISLAQQIEAFEHQIKELAAKQQSAGLSRGLEAIQADIKQAEGQRKDFVGQQTAAANNRDRKKTAISTLELEISNVNGELRQVEYNLKQKTALDEQELEYKNLKADARENVRGIDGKLETENSNLSTEQEIYREVTRRGDEADREQQEKANKLNNAVNKLSSIVQDIQAYLDRGGDSQLARAKEVQNAAEADVARLLSEQRKINMDLKTLDEHIKNYGDSRRHIADNQRFRRDLKQLEAVQGEIAELEARGAEADANRLHRQAETWKDRRNELASDQASVTGELKGLDRELTEAEELFQSEYKDAGKKYQAAHIMVETTKAAINDLGLYWGALDKAIMKFHTLKMEQINAIIDELWRAAYKGTDVDTVLIRSEGVDGTAKGNKAYNYRVVMVKKDTEMDMRGRCSAGQKVLASIIIRLALADVFGQKCGMIALDEPTTNLDIANIRALGKSLGDIIKHRRAQSNFQMIVITHDDEFLGYMNCGDYTDDYWRVSRDENQHTLIEKQNISGVL